MKKLSLSIMAVVLALFGAVTLFMSSSVIFDLFGIREKEGNYVLFVVVVNFACGLLYLPAAYGFYTNKGWSVLLLIVSLLMLVLAFGGLMLHIQTGGIYEIKTIGALLFRIVLTLAIAVLGHRVICRAQRKALSGNNPYQFKNGYNANHVTKGTKNEMHQ